MARELVLLPAQTITASGNSAAHGEIYSDVVPAAFQIKVGTVTGTTPNLVMKIQDSIDGGTTWFDLVTFTAITATGASEIKRVSPPYGRKLRLSWTVTGTTPNFANVEVRMG